MGSLSLNMIVKDDPESLLACLESIEEVCDEIVIVVDEGADPDVERIVEDHASKKIHHPLSGHFGNQRQIALDATTGDIMLWLDSDDFVPEKTRDVIRKIADRCDQQIDAYMFPYWYSIEEDGTPRTILLRERMIRVGRGLSWRYPVHEVFSADDSGKVVAARVDVPIHHMRKHPVGDRNCRIMDEHLSSYHDDSRMQLYAGNEYMKIGRFDDAERAYRRNLEIEKWSEHRAISFLRLAALLAIRGDLDEATEMAMNSISEEPLRPDPYLLLGDLAAMRKKTHLALHWYKIASNMQTPIHCLMPVDTNIVSHAKNKFDELSTRCQMVV